MAALMRKIIRTDGTVIDLPERAHSLDELHRLTNVDCFDAVMLSDGVHVMLVDDTGLLKGLPMNTKATCLYWNTCGGPTNHFIAGDVAIVPDVDY